MTLAGSVGLNVPPVWNRPVGSKPCIVVQRYDRSLDAGGSVTRVHQEDGPGMSRGRLETQVDR